MQSSSHSEAWASTATARTVQFSVGASGGVSYEWDFGDGGTSASTSPTHAYATPGSYTAKLTVVYADGERATQTVNVPVSDDTIAPTTTVQINDTTLGNWVKADRAEHGVSDAHGVLPLTAAERAELTKLRKENAKLKVEREILKKAAAFFVTESTR